MSVKNLVLGALAATLIAIAPGTLAQTPPATALVQSAVEQVLDLLRDESLQGADRRARLRDVIAPNFDFEAMSRSILAAAWKKGTPEEQQRFVALFQKLLEDTYITAMEEYTDQTVRYGEEKHQGKLALVETYIVRSSGGEIPVFYRLREQDGKWVAIDVTVEGVSLINNYRSSFGSIVRKDGLGGLNDQLEKKLNSNA